MPLLRGLLVLPLLCWTACGGATTGRDGSTPRPSSANMISYEELREHGQYSNLYDLIEVLRPRWLRPQGGPDTFTGSEGQVQVHMDGNRMGDVGVLRGLSAAGVTSIEWLTPMAASSRFGMDHSHGAIVISTRPIH